MINLIAGLALAREMMTTPERVTVETDVRVEPREQAFDEGELSEADLEHVTGGLDWGYGRLD